MKKVLACFFVCATLLLGIVATSLPAQKVTLTYAYDSAFDASTGPIIEKFNKEHPEIKIVPEPLPWTGFFERLFTHFMAGTEPPIIGVHAGWIHRFASLGFLADLDPYIPQIDIEDFWPSLVKHYQYKGKQYVLPLYADVYGWAYNTDLYKEAGLNPDKPPQNRAEMVDHLKKLTMPEKEQYGLGIFAKSGSHELATLVNMFIRQDEGRVLSEDYTRCTLNEPAAIEAVRFFTNLYLKQEVTNLAPFESEIKDIDKMFAMGTVAAYISSAGRVTAVYAMNPEINFYSAPLPKGKRWEGARMMGWGVGISSRTKHKDEAWKFVEFYLSPDSSQIHIDKGGHPGPRISTAKAHPKLGKQPYIGYMTAMEKGYGAIDPPIEAWYQVAITETDNVQKILLGLLTVEEALSEATKEIDEILRKE